MLASSHNADFHFRSNDMLQPAVTTKVLCNILWFVSNLKLNRVFCSFVCFYHLVDATDELLCANTLDRCNHFWSFIGLFIPVLNNLS